MYVCSIGKAAWHFARAFLINVKALLLYILYTIHMKFEVICFIFMGNEIKILYIFSDNGIFVK